MFVCHNGRGVGVYKHHVDAFIAQNAARLSAGVVKLGRLTDNNGTRADHKYLVYVFIFRH